MLQRKVKLGLWDSEITVYSDATPQTIAFVIPEWGITKAFKFPNFYHTNVMETIANLIALKFVIETLNDLSLGNYVIKMFTDSLVAMVFATKGKRS